MFKILLGTILLGLLIVPSYAETENKEKSGPACELCTLVLTAAKSLLAKNETEAEVLQFIEKELCSRLGPLSTVCVNFLETTGAEILADLANGLDPQAVCKKFNLCSAETFQIEKSNLKAKSGPACELCTLVLTAAKSLLAKNETEAEVLQFIEKELCSRLGPLSTTCVNFLETTGAQILADLANGLDPQAVCKKFNLCSPKEMKIRAEKHIMKSKSGPACELCTLVLTAAKSLLAKNETEAKVLQFIENELCSRLGPLSTTCVNFLETTGAEILADLANGLDPQAVCKKFNLCSFELSNQSPNSLNCTVCKLVMTQIENLLQNNQSEAQIINYLDSHVCSLLGPLQTLCDTIVNTYGPVAIKLLSQKIDPEKVCEIIGMCTNKTVTHLERNRSAKINKLRIKEKSGPACELCTLVLTAAKSLLAKNETEAEVLQFIEKELCSRLGPLSTVCVNFLETTGAEILADLANGLDPQAVCKKFNLCSAKAMKARAEKSKLKGKSGPACELCTLVLTAAKSLLAKNETEAEVLQFIEKELCSRLGPLSTVCVNFLETTGAEILADLANGLDPQAVCKKFNLCISETKFAMLTLEANPLECTVCQYVVQFLDNELKGNKSEDAVLNALKNVCKIVPSSLKDKCDNLIDTYGVYLVQLLFEFADPLKVCQAINVC